MLKRLRESTFRKFSLMKEHGPIKYPSNHQPGMEVPEGGSSCANCRFLHKDERHCMSPGFILWNGSSLIPGHYTRYCSNWWEPRPGKKT